MLLLYYLILPFSAISHLIDAEMTALSWMHQQLLLMSAIAAVKLDFN